MKRYEIYISEARREKESREQLAKARKELEYLSLQFDIQKFILEERLKQKAGFQEDQPRVPAGNPDGGQWTSEGGGSGEGGGGSAGRFESLPKTEEKPNPISRPRESAPRTTHFKDLDGKVRKIPKGVGNPREFGRHVTSNAKSFNTGSGKNYLSKAHKFREYGIKNKLPMAEDKNGILRIYDPKTNTFGSYNKDGSYKTFFKPKEGDSLKGYKYYENVLEKTLKNGGKEINKLSPRNSGGGRGTGFINPKDPFNEFPDDDIFKYFEPLVERKYFPATEDCGN